MVKHLEADYEVTKRSVGPFVHIFDILKKFGGLKSFVILILLLLGFYLYVDWVIKSSRQKKRNLKQTLSVLK